MRRAYRSLVVVFIAAAFLNSPPATAAGAQAAAGSSSRGQYLALQGLIIPPREVIVDSYIAAIDYRYPLPTDRPVGVTLYSGNRQLSASGQEEIIQIGIQAGKTAFDELPPMNLAFVIDKSGSMQASDKMDWVKEAFAIFIEKVRPIDFVSLVTFDSTAKIVYPSMQMNDRSQRLLFRDAVRRITPGGGTNLVAGFELGYRQVMANYRTEYTNRVLFLTDGVGESRGLLEMAESYKEIGVNVSTIGVGTDFDLKLMDELARRGGGSSRFIANRKEMAETFGEELDRMVVPAVTNVTMRLELPRGYTVLETWGYAHQILGREVRFALPTLHHRDYETILVRVQVPPGLPRGVQELARFTLSYSDIDGTVTNAGPYLLEAEVVSAVSPACGFSDGMVLKSGTMLRFARSLVRIGEAYYSSKDDLDRINAARETLWNAGDQKGEFEKIASPDIQRMESLVQGAMQRAMDLPVEMKKELVNARLRLDNEGFDDEIAILDSYIRVLGGHLRLPGEKVAAIGADVEVVPSVVDRPLHEHLTNLFREITLSMGGKARGAIAVSGFVNRDGKESGLVTMLNEMAVVTIAGYDTLKVVERSRIDRVIAEQKLQLTELFDTSTAIEIGRLLAASYILTGTVIEMSNSVVVFGRIINVETGEVESVAQVILPKSADVKALLS